MKHLLWAMLLSCSFLAMGQDSTWTQLELGNHFSMNFPQNHTQNDSTEFEYYRATIGENLLFAGVIPRDPYFYGDEEELADDYQKYLEGVLSKLPNAEVKDDKSFELGGLIGKNYVIHFGETAQRELYLEQKVVITNDATFTFQFKSTNPISTKSDSLKTAFLSSIEAVEGVDSEIQIIPGSVWGYNPYQKGRLLSRSFLYIVLPGLLILFQYIKWRKAKRAGK
ncbi:hypothetical protein R9C00_04800 [Flammeovirgaceae bacterium SG7u.111]|nr:hypothetical protein [Flammeovirgaceae bacterium SG7u.132]WPO36762.1 hypothetical protein R9C00_04800 [Flammeovirgaceae bacterium SG7u.111]